MLYLLYVILNYKEKPRLLLIHIIHFLVLIPRLRARVFVVVDVYRSQGDCQLFTFPLTPDTVQRSLNVLLMAEHIVYFLKSRFLERSY